MIPLVLTFLSAQVRVCSVALDLTPSRTQPFEFRLAGSKPSDSRRQLFRNSVMSNSSKKCFRTVTSVRRRPKRGHDGWGSPEEKSRLAFSYRLPSSSTVRRLTLRTSAVSLVFRSFHGDLFDDTLILFSHSFCISVLPSREFMWLRDIYADRAKFSSATRIFFWEPLNGGEQGE